MPLLPDADGDGPTLLDIDYRFSQFPASRLPALCFQSATFSYHPCNICVRRNINMVLIHKYFFVFSIRLGIKPVAVAPAESSGGANGNRLDPT